MKRLLQPLVVVLISSAGVLSNGVPAHAVTTPHQRAKTEAKALLAEAPVLDGATASATPPVKPLASSPTTWTYSDTVTLSKFWTIDESSDKAEHDLTAVTPDGLTQSSTGSTSGPKYAVNYTVDTPKMLPGGIDDAELVLAITALGHHQTAIAAYSLVAPEPNRPQREVLPASTHRVTVEVRAGAHAVRRKHVVLGSVARQLATDFNDLRMPPTGGVYNCANDSPPYRDVVTRFSFAGHKLTATTGSGTCGFVAVRRGGHRLPGLFDSRAFDHVVRAALAPRTVPNS